MYERLSKTDHTMTRYREMSVLEDLLWNDEIRHFTAQISLALAKNFIKM